MLGRTHDLAAFTTLGVIVLSQPPRTVTLATALVAIFANLVGGIAPDADQPTAPFWRNLPVGKYFGKLFGMLNGGHRFLTHSLVGVALFAVALHWLLVFLHPIMLSVDRHLVLLSFLVGMLSHLVMDSFTKEGVPWLLPIPVKFGFPPIRALRITTGKILENYLIFPAFIVFNGWWYSTHYQKILEIVHHHIV